MDLDDNYILGRKQHTLKILLLCFYYGENLRKTKKKKTELDPDGYYSPSRKRHKLQNLPPCVLIVVKIKKEKKRNKRPDFFNN